MKVEENLKRCVFFGVINDFFFFFYSLCLRSTCTHLLMINWRWTSSREGRKKKQNSCGNIVLNVHLFIYLSLLASVLENKYISEQEISNALSKKTPKNKRQEQQNKTKHRVQWFHLWKERVLSVMTNGWTGRARQSWKSRSLGKHKNSTQREDSGSFYFLLLKKCQSGPPAPPPPHHHRLDEWVRSSRLHRNS